MPVSHFHIFHAIYRDRRMCHLSNLQVGVVERIYKEKSVQVVSQVRLLTKLLEMDVALPDRFKEEAVERRFNFIRIDNMIWIRAEHAEKILAFILR
jgi:hypothetical protein